MRTRRLAAAALVLLLSACAPPDLTPAPTTAASDAPPGDASPPPGDTAPGPAPGPEPAPPPPPEPCTAADLTAIDETIGGQLAAFAADDWETALGYASSDFQAATDVESFAALIETGYPIAADAVSHRSRDCQQRPPGAAEVRVEVTAADGATAVLVYLLVDEDGWRIAGAVELDAIPDASTV